MLSNENVEKVVNPPQNPVISNSLYGVCKGKFLSKTPIKIPIKKQPNALTIKVPLGNE